MIPRIGTAFDAHQIQPGKDCWIAGLLFEGVDGCEGHSDGDVVSHAIVDALLGAAALGDIGSHFPDTDPQWKDVDSTELLAAVTREVRAAGYRIGNVDATVICERPKLRPCIELIRERLASVMSVGKGRVSVKGKTNEKMDDVGAGVGISVHAVCLLEEARI